MPLCLTVVPPLPKYYPPQSPLLNIQEYPSPKSGNPSSQVLLWIEGSVCAYKAARYLIVAGDLLATLASHPHSFGKWENFFFKKSLTPRDITLLLVFPGSDTTSHALMVSPASLSPARCLIIKPGQKVQNIFAPTPPHEYNVYNSSFKQTLAIPDF